MCEISARTSILKVAQAAEHVGDVGENIYADVGYLTHFISPVH